MDNSKNRHNNDHLGVNKTGKNIRKSPLHQPNFANANTNTNTNTANNNPARQQPQPHVYNISKNDFRNMVQRLTGSPSQDVLPRPPNNPPKSQSMRLQKIRPPPLPPFKRPHVPPPAPVPVPQPLPPVPYNNFPRPAQFGGYHRLPLLCYLWQLLEIRIRTTLPSLLSRLICVTYRPRCWILALWETHLCLRRSLRLWGPCRLIILTLRLDQEYSLTLLRPHSTALQCCLMLIFLHM